MRAMRQPAVLGEMLGGVILGPTVLGAALPRAFEWLFHSSDAVSVARESLTWLGLLFFLFVVGLQADLSDLRRQGRQALALGLAGTLVPVAAGIGLVQALPAAFWGPLATASPFAFALVVGLNLANSAIPVLARTLLDLGFFESRIGTISMTAALVGDLATWACFALVLSQLMRQGATAPASAAFGTHVFLVALLLGVALRGSARAHPQARDAIVRFVLGCLAPLYFVSLGLTTDFARSFDARLVAVILVVAIASKLAGVLLGARLAGLPLDRQTWAIGFGLNARGATGIILAAVGREAGVIDERVFVALATMAFLTSLMAGPAMRWLLAGRPPDPLRAGA